SFRSFIEYALSINVPFSTMKQTFESPSLLNDSQFERGIASWFKTNPNADHSILSVVNEGANGEKCIKITSDGSVSRTIFQEFPVRPGEEVFGKIQFQSENYVSGTVFVTIEFLDFKRNVVGSQISIANISSN